MHDISTFVQYPPYSNPCCCLPCAVHSHFNRSTVTSCALLYQRKPILALNNNCLEDAQMDKNSLEAAAVFSKAVDIAQGLPKSGPIQTSYEDKLQLYALFKQATLGDVSTSRPGILDQLGALVCHLPLLVG